MPNPDIYPIQLLGSFREADNANPTLGLYLLSEGYEHEQDFIADCTALVAKLKLLAPFTKLDDAAVLTVQAAFCAAPAGAAVPVGTAPYDAAAMTTAFGGYFQAGTSAARGTFYLDYAKVVEVGSRVQLWSAQQGVYAPLLQAPSAATGAHAYQYQSGAIVILMPAYYAGHGQSGSFNGLSTAEQFQLELEHSATEGEPLTFTATSANEGCERVAARALALAWGLGDESEQLVGAPDPAIGRALNSYPNLFYAPTWEDATTLLAYSKWQSLAQQPITLRKKSVETNAPLDEQSSRLVAPTIDHCEGGGGYSNSVYRPVHECLMRQKPGVGKLSLKLSQHPFCPVCYAYLYKAIAGEYSTKRTADSVTLATQRSEYNKVNWARTTVYNQPTPAPASFTVGPGDESVDSAPYKRSADPAADAPRAFWGYTSHLSPKDGFYLTNVRVHQSLYYDPTSTILPLDQGLLRHYFRSLYGPLGLDKLDKYLQHYNKRFRKIASAPTDFRDVFSRIGFANLTVTFDTATTPPFTFEVADYIRRKDFVFKRASHGAVGMDDLYQSGLHLLLVEDRPGWPRLELELSVVLRSTADDFDPGGAANALKCYPQIQFRWSQKAGSTLRVARFDGTVQLDCTTQHYMYDATYNQNGSHFKPGHHAAGGGMTMPMPAGTSKATSNDISCFTDSNISTIYGSLYLPINPQTFLDNGKFNTAMRRQGLELATPAVKPTWAALFDYYYPHAVTPVHTTKSFVGAYPRDTPSRAANIRKLYVKHLVEQEDGKDPVYDDIFITKFARQGAYDNIHVNGYMGKHQGFAGVPWAHAQAIAEEDVVAAPFCGQDCFHLHWRWSLLSETTANLLRIAQTIIMRATVMNPASFRGWSDTRSHQTVGAPLIPPNQLLTVDLTHHSEQEKGVGYHVRIEQPAPNENQVIMEQGTGWAMTYADMPGVSLIEGSVLTAPPLDPASGVMSVFDHETNFDKIYDFIRFHHTYEPILTPLAESFTKLTIHNHAQVPEGSVKPTMTWPQNDKFVTIYRNKGDFYKNLPDVPALNNVVDYHNYRLYDHPQLVVDAVYHPELATVSLEDL